MFFYRGKTFLSEKEKFQALWNGVKKYKKNLILFGFVVFEKYSVIMRWLEEWMFLRDF